MLYGSVLGDLILESDGSALTGLRFGCSVDAWMDGEGPFTTELQQKKDAGPDAGKNKGKDASAVCGKEMEKPLEIFEETRLWLDCYFEGRDPGAIPPIRLDTNATPFRKEVWEILLSIPYGKTLTYSEIAARIAKARGIRKMSAQAVGGAVSQNPIAIIVPCHRVIGADGKLTGYAGGLARKAWLLDLEQSAE